MGNKDGCTGSALTNMNNLFGGHVVQQPVNDIARGRVQLSVGDAKVKGLPRCLIKSDWIEEKTNN